MSPTSLLVCFVSLIKSTCETKKNVFFYFTLKVLLRQSDFNFSDIQMSWHHQMPKNETGNTFYWITWNINVVW